MDLEADHDLPIAGFAFDAILAHFNQLLSARSAGEPSAFLNPAAISCSTFGSAPSSNSPTHPQQSPPQSTESGSLSTPNGRLQIWQRAMLTTTSPDDD